MIKLTIRSSSNLSLFFLYSSQVAHKMESAPNAAIFNPIRFCILFWSNFELSKLFSSVSFITNKLPRAQSFNGFQNWPIEIRKDQGSLGTDGQWNPFRKEALRRILYKSNKIQLQAVGQDWHIRGTRDSLLLEHFLSFDQIFSKIKSRHTLWEFYWE